MGFSLDPQKCLEEAVGDLRHMGCTIYYKQCQEVNTIARQLLLGAPNTIDKEMIKQTLDEELKLVEQKLLSKNIRVVNREVKEYIVQEDVEQAIQRECEVRFSLAHSAPIMKLLLSERLRYLSDKSLARSIIMGTYDIPSDLDPAAKLILEEIGKLGIKIVNGEGNEIVITPDDFKRFWRKVNKFTSSSMSGVHYGHYMAAIQDDLIYAVLALQLTVIARSGVPPENWTVGLQVMLEKIAGVCLVEKLRAIQLYEADFNCYNQFVFGRNAMQTLTESGYIPEELFSQQGSTAEEAKFDKTLMADLSCQARHPMIVTSADAAYCYD
jgi:hypothetical protein